MIAHHQKPKHSEQKNPGKFGREASALQSGIFVLYKDRCNAIRHIE
jgi:hypothetical protein